MYTHLYFVCGSSKCDGEIREDSPTKIIICYYLNISPFVSLSGNTSEYFSASGGPNYLTIFTPVALWGRLQKKNKLIAGRRSRARFREWCDTVSFRLIKLLAVKSAGERNHVTPGDGQERRRENCEKRDGRERERAWHKVHFASDYAINCWINRFCRR